MQFQVPQFIEVEDKIFGPFTIKQFLYLAGGAGMCFVVYKFLPIFIAIIIIPIIAGFSAALAFYKYNSRPFIDFVESVFTYFTGNKLYIWKKDINKPVTNAKIPTKTPQKLDLPKLTSESKLKELSWSLDIKESQNPLTGGDNQTNT